MELVEGLIGRSWAASSEKCPVLQELYITSASTAGSAHDIYNAYNKTRCGTVIYAVTAPEVDSDSVVSAFFPLLGRDLPQAIFAFFPVISIPPCIDNASAARSASARVTKLTNAQSASRQPDALWLHEMDSRLAVTIVMDLICSGLTNGHVKTVAVRTSASEHSGRPRKMSVVCLSAGLSTFCRQADDGLILWCLQPFRLRLLAHDLLGHRVVPPIVPIHQILLLQTVLLWQLMPEWALASSFALALDEEAADVGPIPLVVRVRPSNGFEHLPS